MKNYLNLILAIAALPAFAGESHLGSSPVAPIATLASPSEAIHNHLLGSLSERRRDLTARKENLAQLKTLLEQATLNAANGEYKVNLASFGVLSTLAAGAGSGLVGVRALDVAVRDDYQLQSARKLGLRFPRRKAPYLAMGAAFSTALGLALTSHLSSKSYDRNSQELTLTMAQRAQLQKEVEVAQLEVSDSEEFLNLLNANDSDAG